MRAAGPRRRLFFAAWATESFGRQLHASVAAMLGAVPGRPVAPADWHVTLCFLGAVEQTVLGALQAGAGQIQARAFELRFEQIEYWRQARVISVTAATVPESARALAGALRALARSLALASEERPLRAHVTLMRGVIPAVWEEFRAGPGRLPQRVDLTLEAHEFHLAESLEVPQAAGTPSAPPRGPLASGAPAPARRYASLSRWPLPT
ncbi:MAG TPA: RNA 2',3'-cyclic phosphodiesterase [Steroidobacteraceae bacterium]|jgi:2'-5' RNA ligase|nr:RNA 2',3'-cyclic phosphodiesterase [Steroidobacteraceae bacterium]